jgi:polyketide biosynthesis enoyl-CoA hydratase PksI
VKATLSDLGDGIFGLDVAGSLSDDVSALANAVATLPTRAKCVVLFGGNDVFNSGATRGGLTNAERPITDYVAKLPRLMLDFPVPTIAAMAGHALGGGLLLGLWCDLAVFAEDRLYGANFMALGFTPGMGATLCLEEAFGSFLGREMLYTGKLLTGMELRARGAPLPHVVPRAQVEARARELAEDIVAVPQGSLQLLRRTLSARRRVRLEAVLLDEGHMHKQVFADPETRARIADLLPEE